jgi:hypothetical protein
VSTVRDEFPADLRVTDDEAQQLAEALLEAQKSTPLLSARAIKSKIPESFDEAVTQALYSRVDLAKLRDGQSTLQSLVRLSIPRTKGTLRAIVTYNFDDLLEQALDHASVEYSNVCRETDRLAQGVLGIYHVHGFLPQNANRRALFEDVPLVLAEDGYHDLYSDPFRWSNLVQLSFVRENTCLFLGLSMTDPNLRRLLEIAQSATRKSGIMLCCDAQRRMKFWERRKLPISAPT